MSYVGTRNSPLFHECVHFFHQFPVIHEKVFISDCVFILSSYIYLRFLSSISLLFEYSNVIFL